MVAMNSTFDNPTPHGGPPFQGWKMGFGFGHARGPGGYVGDPSIAAKLKETPGGDRCYANNGFWRRKAELGLANSFGIGPRPDHGLRGDGVNVSPDQYGDITHCVRHVKEDVTRRGQTLKKRFPSMEQKYRDNSWPKSGPGPGKYDTRIPPGQGSWSHPVAAPSWSMGGKSLHDNELRLKTLEPGPCEYDTRVKAGKNGPIRHCSSKGLYDITLKSRTKIVEPGACSPGPARYNLKGKFDEYGLAEKISNAKCPPWEELKRMPSPMSSPNLSLSKGDGFRDSKCMSRGGSAPGL